MSKEDNHVLASRELHACRQELEKLDLDLVQLLAQRVKIARRTGSLKRVSGVPILDPQREAAVIRQAVSHARKLGVPEEPVRQIFWQIVGLSRRAQEETE